MHRFLGFTAAHLLCAFTHSVRGAGLEQMQHIVIFMQENRPFDHYFGTMQGVRGFNDRATVPLKSGLNAFYQPVSSASSEYMLPFRADANQTNAMCMPAPEMCMPSFSILSTIYSILLIHKMPGIILLT